MSNLTNPFEYGTVPSNHEEFAQQVNVITDTIKSIYGSEGVFSTSPYEMAYKFARWYMDKFGHGPMGPEEWIKYGDQWQEESGFATSGTTAGGQGSGLDQYLKDRGVTTTTTPTDTTTTTTETVKDPETGEDVTIVDAFPDASVSSEGDKVYNNGIYYIFRNGQWIADQYGGLGDSGLTDGVVDDSSEVFDDSTMEEITVTGTQPEGFDWSSILSGLGGLGGLGSLIGGIAGLSTPDVSGGFLETIFDLLKRKKAIDEYNKYKVPTGQMDAQSEIGKQWGLPTRESMVLQGLGPNYLQGQKYAMNLGQTMPAATHTVGMPYIEKGKHGGIMGIQQSYGDITPAFLEPGEFVFTKKATDNIGAKRLYKLMKQAEQMGME
jgi:hypothetical protein